MTDSEMLAIAAHLHVLLRRKISRVTDVEWMLRSREYSAEVVRVARGEAHHPDLREWANKLEQAMGAFEFPEARVPSAAAQGVRHGLTADRCDQPAPAPATSPARRYVSGLR